MKVDFITPEYDKMIEFIVPTYNSPKQLMTMLGSLVSQTSPNWKCHVISDGDDDNIHLENMKIIDILNDKRIRYTRIEGPNKDWGHTARNYGLQHANEYWVVMSGSDNYYTPAFVKEFLHMAKINEQASFIFCDMIHNLVLGGYVFIPSQLQKSFIDIGNFMSKTEYSKQLKLNKDSYEADFDFIKEYIYRFIKEDMNQIKKINKILYIHN